MTGAAGMPGVIPGLDLQDHAAVREALSRWGTRYRDALLGDEERAAFKARADAADERGGAAEDPTRVRWLAGRFAAKEAVFKTLGAADTNAVPWPQIQILPTSSGAARVRLGGAAGRLARARGVGGLEVSITHGPGVSAACALAVLAPAASSPAAPADPPTTDPTTAAPAAEAPAAPAAVIDLPHHLTHTLRRRLTERNAMTDRQSIEERVRAVLDQQAQLATPIQEVGSQDSLYAAGMTSHASVSVMLQLEDEFDLEFPEDKLNRQTFVTVSSIADALEELL